MSNGDGESGEPRLLFLTSALLDDRKLLYTDVLPKLKEHNVVSEIWATSVRNEANRAVWEACDCEVVPFPEVKPFKVFPYNILRRLNEYVWDFALKAPSRLSMMRHVRSKDIRLHFRVLLPIARALAAVGLAPALERYVERKAVSFPRCEDAVEMMRERRPSVVIATGPNRFEEPGVIAAAKQLGIKTLALIHSWDNLSVKHRMLINYDGYLVWSEQMKKELLHFYPQAKEVPIYVVGATQFDVFFQDEYRQSREAFCKEQGLRPALPLIVYALGSPNFLKEHHGAIRFAKRVEAGELGEVQLLIRPHPQFDEGKESELLEGLGSNIVVQKTGDRSVGISGRVQEQRQIVEWVNTFRHADVVVNLSSSVAIDAALFDRPVVNLDFDPEPGQPNQALIKEINHLWTHFKPIAESGGLQLVNNDEEIVKAVRTYLENPGLHREGRKWMAEYVCGFTDGACGRRMADALAEFVGAR